MGFIIGFAVIFLLVIGMFVFRDLNSEVSKRLKGNKDKFYNFSYRGGFEDVSINNSPNGIMVLRKDYIEIILTKNNKIIQEKQICYSDIKKVKIMNNITISEQISIGKMICLGWLALGLPNKKEEVKEYLVLDVTNNNENASIIFEVFFNNLMNALNDIKIKVENV